MRLRTIQCVFAAGTEVCGRQDTGTSHVIPLKPRTPQRMAHETLGRTPVQPPKDTRAHATGQIAASGGLVGPAAGSRRSRSMSVASIAGSPAAMSG
jgi:hypothetical protein